MAKELVKRRSSNGMGRDRKVSHQSRVRFLTTFRKSAIKRLQKAPVSMSARQAAEEADRLIGIAKPHILELA